MNTRLVSMVFAALLLSWSAVPFAGEFEDGLAAYNRRDYKTAFAMFSKVANKGDAGAQTFLGGMYAEGQSVPQDYNQALSWFRKAADQGYALAQSLLGSMYSEGKGVSQDHNQAASWYRKAADQGNRGAQYNLGFAYNHGLGVAQDYREAAKWFRKAADQGDADAQTFLGTMYENGEGVFQDISEAIKYYHLAADQKQKNALHILGRLSELGIGVFKNIAFAYVWYSIGALENNSASAIEKKRLESALTASQMEEALDLLRRCQRQDFKRCYRLPTSPAHFAESLKIPPLGLKTPVPVSVPQNIIPLEKVGGTYVVSVLINGAITLKFTVDSGAADVIIPNDVFLTLIRTGTITDSDFLGSQIYVLADGSKMPSQKFRIRALKIGDVVVENVTGSIAPVQGSLLLGQSFLGRLKSWSMDNTKHVLIIN